MTPRKALLMAAVLVLSIPVVPALAHDDEYSNLIGRYAFRHHVKPGITGWAQIQGARGRTEQVELMKKRIDFDLWYINNWSVGLDLLILLRTFAEVLRHRNAY